MPPKSKQPRCAYVERGQRCRRAGTGNPALCDAHRIVLEEEAARQPRPGERIINLLGRAFRGQKISDKQVHAGIEDLVDLFQQYPTLDQLRAQAQAKARQYAQQWQQQQQQRTNGHAHPRQPKPTGPDPRLVLGFAVGQKITAEDVKKRHRELARKHHPDRGGSVAKMQEINAAVDQLLASM